MLKSEKARAIAKRSIRQINKPKNHSRRRDDWKWDTLIANLEQIMHLLEDPNGEIEEEGGLDDKGT
jgi:hypothetical protein